MKKLLSILALSTALLAQNKIDLSRQTKGGPLPAGSVPASSASNFGGVKDLDCTGSGHVVKLASGLLTCSADSGAGSVTHTLGALGAASPVVGNGGGDEQTLNNYTVVDNSTAARTFNLPDANGSLIQLVPLTTHQWINQINAQGAGGTARPDCGDLTALDGIVCTLTSPVAGQVLGFSDSTHIVNAFVTSPPDAPITSCPYPIVTGDRAHLKIFNSASACAVSLPAASSAGFTGKFRVRIHNEGAGLVTVTPATSTIGFAALSSWPINQGENCTITGNDTDYPDVDCSSGQLVAGTGMTLTRSSTGVTIALTTPVAVASGGTNTSSTLTGLVRGGASYTAAELSGDATTSGSNAVTVAKVNGGSLPASAFTVGTNSSNQLIAAQLFAANAQTSTYQVVAADFAGCKTIPVSSGTFTVTLVASGSQPASGQCVDIVNYGSGVVTVARSGQNINGAAANLTIAAGSASAPNGLRVVSDGTNYVAQPWLGAAGSGTVTSVATTSPITGGTITNTGTIACATCTTNASALTSGQLMTGAGGQAAQVGNLSGDVTTAGTTATTVVKVNGAAVPASATALASNSSSQLIAATLQGNGSKVQLSTGSTTANDLAKYDANGNVIDSGSPLGPINVNGSQVTAPTLANNFQALGSNIYWTNTPQFLTGFGDSITAGTTGVTGSLQDFLDLMAVRTGGGETNYAVSGAQAADVAKLQVIANTQTMTAPPLVVGNLATSTSGGSLAAATSDCVKITYNTVLGETTPSPEACITTGAGSSNSVTVTAPIPTNGQAGYLTGYTVYSGLTTAELKQAASNNCVNISIGTNCVIQVLGAGAAPPGTNTAYLPNTTEDNLTTLLVGTNDVTQYGATASLQTVFKQTLDTSIVWSSSATPVFAQSASCVGTGAWSNDNTGLSGLGTQSTTNGNTLACSNIQVNNGVLYVIYRIINSDGGTFTVKDGTTVLTDQITSATTLNGFPGASMTTLNGTTDSFATARFTGLANGLHTINFTVTSATNGANVVSISALSTVPGLTYATPERIYVGGVLKQQTDANSALTDAYNTLVKNQVAALAADGLLVYFADVRSYVNSTSDMFNSLHPNNTGQAHLRDAFAAQIQYPMNNSFYQLCFGQLTPQVAGPDACLYRQNAGELSLGSLTRGDKSGTLDVAALNIYNGATKEGIFSNGGFTQSSSGYVGFSSSSTAATPVVAKMTGNGSTNVFNFGSGSGGTTGILGFTTGNINGGLNIGSTPPACTVGTAGTFCASEGTAFTNVASTAGMYPDSTTHEFMAKTNGSASAGILVRTQPGSVNPVSQTAAITTATLCAAAAGACNVAGQYHIHWNFWGSGTACSSVTAGSVTFLLTWTDENAVTHSAVAEEMVSQTGAATTAMQTTFPFQTALANESGSGDVTISTNGTIIQYATGYTACTTGTGTYNLRASVDRIQ